MKTQQKRPARPTKLGQCVKCPWRKDVDPFDIPNGYCPTKHRALKDTIAAGPIFGSTTIKMMACHESIPGRERMCAGWIANQLGPGNNIPLRLMASRGEVPEVALVGEQHETFEDTLPGGYDDEA